MLGRGFFITLEGSEGTGKSTNSALLKGFLTAAGYRVFACREPGGTVVSEEIRKLLKRDDLPVPLVPAAELLLFSASRAQLVREKIEPALRSGAIVICDRYVDSTLAYQGVARHLPMDVVEQINRFAIGDCVPDLTFILDLDPAVGFQRVQLRQGSGHDRLEQESMEFYGAVRMAYLRLAHKDLKRFVKIDAAQSLAKVQEQIQREVMLRLDGVAIGPERESLCLSSSREQG